MYRRRKIKKNPILAGVLMTLALSVPVNAAEKTQEPFQKVSITNQIVTQSNYSPGYYQVIGTGVRFRSSAGLSGSVITTLSKGEYLYYERAAGPTVYADGYTWLHCERISTGQTGYVAVNYITATTPPPNAPYSIETLNK